MGVRAADAVVEGPAIIEQMDTTSIIDPGCTVASDADGNLIESAEDSAPDENAAPVAPVAPESLTKEDYIQFLKTVKTSIKNNFFPSNNKTIKIARTLRIKIDKKKCLFDSSGQRK